MAPLSVEPEVTSQPGLHLGSDIITIVEVDVSVVDRAPSVLGEDVVQSSVMDALLITM